MTKIVKLEGVTKVYQDGKVAVPALREIDLSIQKGEFVAVAGPSGSGKTTLLNIIGGLDQPTKGSIFLEGNYLGQMGRGELSRLRLNRIGFIFQSYNLIPVLTAFENAEFVLLLQKRPVEERRQKVANLLEEVGLSGLEKRFPREMSGGQQQRVAIARSIASEPALVLADEPTANVDSQTASELLDLMEKLNQAKGVTFFFSTHDPAVMQRARRLITLKDGRVEKDTTK
ncbi:MAG: ABC transporter ATP-binding protein [Thermodesulfobacteriota bacterium]|jgi:putative ABC transport system ATP-binding protein|nr:ABC transporter ATP-binding protein [Deltaproteobacteria bacterium]